MNKKNKMINHPGQWLFEEGQAYLYGSDFKKRDDKRGQLMIEASASAGFTMAVAYCRLCGWNGLKRDYKKAFDEFVKIEKETNGYHYAQYMIGDCYDYAYGTEKDDTKAFEWYSKSMKQGNSAATNNLGFCYYKGKGVEQDLIKGFSLFEQSAHSGHSTGMFSVGICFEEGAGVVKDVNKAKEWYVKAVAHGLLEAQTKLDALNAA